MKALAPLVLSLTSYLLPQATAEAVHDRAYHEDLDFRLPVLPPGFGGPDSESVDVQPKQHEFVSWLQRCQAVRSLTSNQTLRHIFHRGTHRYPGLSRRLDVPSEAQIYITDDENSSKEPVPRLRARSHSLKIERLANREATAVNNVIDAGRLAGQALSLPASAWTIDDVSGPNITDKETVLSFARIAANAYVLEPHTGDWEEVGGGFNYTEDFGWELDGLRGHIFADTENKTIVIGLKGTSPAVFDGADTTTNDKINDNLFFSCCCAQGGQYLWKQVCDCMTSAYTCNSTCLVKSLREKNRYYYAAQDLYHNVTALYPDADIWVSGHSLGGSVASLLGLTFGLPCLTFEAPAEAMAASRLGLPVPPGYSLGFHQQRAMTGGYHFGQTADPIYMGTCNTAYASCTLGGYAMESVCHTGQMCVYDTVSDNGWRVGIGNHRIKSVIHDVIQKYNETPKCEPYADCTDCFNWEYFESNGSDHSTTSRSSSSTKTRTRTTTCKTPGWWGCLDESSTTTSTTTTTSETSTTTTTSTCKTPGWFGCQDPTSTTTSNLASPTTRAPAPVPTVTTTRTVTSTSLVPSTSCKSPGWFGCHDPKSMTMTATTASASRHTSSAASKTTSCKSREWFGLICVDPSPVTTTTTTTTTVTQPSRAPKATCARRTWFGFCREWDQAAGEQRPFVVGWKEDMR